jgi:hypothetical protein
MLEGPAAERMDLAGDAVPLEERENAPRDTWARDVEVHADSPPAAKVEAPSSADQRRELGEAAARFARLDRRQLGADVLREGVLAAHAAGILARERRARRGRREPAYRVNTRATEDAWR